MRHGHNGIGGRDEAGGNTQDCIADGDQSRTHGRNRDQQHQRFLGAQRTIELDARAGQRECRRSVHSSYDDGAEQIHRCRQVQVEQEDIDDHRREEQPGDVLAAKQEHEGKAYARRRIPRRDAGRSERADEADPIQKAVDRQVRETDGDGGA